MNTAYLPRRRLAFATVAAVLLGAATTVCTIPAHAQTPPPPGVEVMVLDAHEVPITYTYAGRVAAFREVEVRAQVGGILKQRAYVEGAKVKAGDVLFRIDSATYEAAVERAAAQLKTAEAQLAQAHRDLDRAGELFTRQVGTQKARDDAQSAVELGAAAVDAAAAQLKTARISLDYATVRAPIEGITSLDVVPEGSLVGSGSADSLLTKITQLDPVYVNFSFTDADSTQIWKVVGSRAKSMAEMKLAAGITFGDGRKYALPGEVDFTSASLDLQTGTVRSRAVFANPDLNLIPGQFVRVTISGISLPSAIVVPEPAVMQGPKGKFVFRIDDGGIASIAAVELDQSVSGGWVVRSGLKSGDRVVTSGVIKVRPGAKVTVTRTLAQTPQAGQ
ncbi:MAG: efflux RND transporter periplasmic adaptor subunit [Ancalomicrobiaceae bacterium]|nr:efflux RND transporter periplasmic adaptor subunit [Ancalomicrobiaceae bacterium]